jgi:tRNA-dihydrouridine synthase A
MGDSLANLDNKLLCVAPMMAWTDRHCRFLHRLYSPSALLFTEMVTTGALIHGEQWHQLDYDPCEHPVALQLGGNNPHELALCAAQAAARGYDEVNLNVGCPSDRVQQGTFGACLMLEPERVAACVAAMHNACDIPVSVKCRLGVDHHDNDEYLQAFIETVAAAGCSRFYIHARKAILGGLSPAQNRSIPPLQPWRVENIKTQRPDLTIVVNGGITAAAQAQNHLVWADGIMIGRAAYHQPQLLSELEQQMFNSAFTNSNPEVLVAYRNYMQNQLAQGVRLSAMTKHLLHSCNGVPGARRFRQILSDSKKLKANNLQLVDDAIMQVYPEAA